MTTFYDELPTLPLGVLTLTATADGLTGVYLENHRHAPTHRSGWVRAPQRLAGAALQLEEYLAGTRQRFTLRLATSAGTPFQRRVWAALDEIGYATTTTYGALAVRLGAPRAVRAVGAANGRNPLSIVRPCHRVIGAGGALTGYGGGLEAKRTLLALEARAASGGEGVGVVAGQHQLGRRAA